MQLTKIDHLIKYKFAPDNNKEIYKVEVQNVHSFYRNNSSGWYLSNG